MLFRSLPGQLGQQGELTREEGECWEAPTPPDGPEQRRPADFRALMQRLREKK